MTSLAHMRISRLIIALILVQLLTACGSRSLGGPTDDAAPPQIDGGALPDAMVPAYNYLGWVTLAHGLYYFDESPSYGLELLSLHAAFRSSSTLFPDEPEPLPLETPDGVPCEQYTLPDDFGPFDRPPSLDVGDIRAWAGPNAGDALAVAFNGENYPADDRNLGIDIWPPWIHEGPLLVLFQTTGGQEVPAFDSELTLPAMQTILAPESSEEPVPPGPDGMHNIMWGPVEADNVRLDFSFDRVGGARIVCFPEPTRTSMLLPHAWIAQHTSGYVFMDFQVFNVRTLVVDNTEVTLRTYRGTNRIFNVLVSP